jgi:hypothetical protein
MTERREHPRIEISWPVVILTGHGAAVGETINIGLSGAFLHCPVPLPEKQKLRLFIMAPMRRPLSVSAEVSWSNRYNSDIDRPPRGMGVRFTDLSKSDEKYLRSVIALTRHYQRKSLDEIGPTEKAPKRKGGQGV